MSGLTRISRNAGRVRQITSPRCTDIPTAFACLQRTKAIAADPSKCYIKWVNIPLQTLSPSEFRSHRSGKKQLRLRDLHKIKKTLRDNVLHTVCEEARCPNRSECFAAGTATFLAMGNICTRGCRFCSIATGRPLPLDRAEPDRLAQAAANMNLKHVVVTSVNRDDLPDGGAAHLAAILKQVATKLPEATREILTPDFKGDMQAVATVCAANPDVFNHNVETVPSLYPQVRPGAKLPRSLDVLAQAALLLPNALIKSGLMLGLGETDNEVHKVVQALADHGVNTLTLGQYFQPTAAQLPVHEMVTQDRYDVLTEMTHRVGIAHVYAGRFVRSSYNAGSLLDGIRSSLKENN